MTAPGIINDLVERFARQFEAYVSPEYKEAQLRQEFINPFFEALGWDVYNRHGFAEQYKEVIHEDAVKIGGYSKAPDYSFRVGGRRVFFVETKKPCVNLKENPEPALQLRRYAWSAKLPLSVLTDFEGFAVYDCRIRPRPRDKAATGRTEYVSYQRYADEWDRIAGVFSRDAVLQGSFDQYAQRQGPRRGTAEVDLVFLKQIETWREVLAKNLARRNQRLSIAELNFAVQAILDRLVFLRICEDRGIETYEQLRSLQNGAAVYGRLCELFERADKRYNSGLFHFEEEQSRAEPPDQLTLTLKVDDGVIKDIISGLYPPESPYEFSVLPADILGQVYEQFLGKVIRLTKGHQAKVEDKPEVKKAGGVYYTPTYIVEYIVKQTVGRLLEGKTPKQAAKLRVLDPACGSGSFLIVVYQDLLDWHRGWYVNDGPEKHREQIYQGPGGVWQLTTAERKCILTNSIYGVDIDPQAVEVTKLSLLLKVLEGESLETIQTSLRLFHERALPDLGDNIKCGNSLVGPDLYEGDLLAAEERARAKVFNWQGEWADILTGSGGGFDAVIGNPPYGADLSEAEVAYLQRAFSTGGRTSDTYVFFMEQAVRLCRPGGFVSMIVPTGWYSGAQFSALRQHTARATDPVSFVNLPYDVFKAWVDTTVFVLKKRSTPTTWPRTAPCTVQLRTFPKRHRIRSSTELVMTTTPAEFVEWFADGADDYLTYANSGVTRLLRKVQARGKPFGQLADIQRGVTPFALTETRTHSTSRPAFDGTVRRYLIDRGPKRYIRFDHTIAEPKPERYFTGPRLLLRELISRQFRLQAVRVDEPFVTNKSLQSILAQAGGPSLYYLLGILNSRLMSWYFLRRSQVGQRDDFPKIVLKETRALPVALPEGKQGPNLARQLEAFVEQMVNLTEKLASARTAPEKETLQRQADATDQQIDRIVYNLYGLTVTEIETVESSQ